MANLQEGKYYTLTNREDSSWVIENARYADDKDAGKLTFIVGGGNTQFTREDLEAKWLSLIHI